MLQPGRQYSAGSQYRYGFNGKEKDKEIVTLTAYDYGFRIYNPAIGRFLSVDPLTVEYPFFSPYQFAGNNPILSVDIDGKEPDKVINENEKIEGSSLTLGEILKKAQNIPNWYQIAKANENTPKLNLSNKEMIDISATVIGESGHGQLSQDQQIKIGWVYYNRIAKSGFKKGMQGSYAYNRSSGNGHDRNKDVLPTIDVMAVMVSLGDNTYANKSAEGNYGAKTIANLIEVKDDFLQGYLQKGKELKEKLTTEFSYTFNNPVPGFENQGYHGDFNRPDAMWKMARAYYWLQEEGKVGNRFGTTFVIKLRTVGAESKTTFIFNLNAIQKYFKENPDQLQKDVPKYDYTTDKKEETKQ